MGLDTLKKRWTWVKHLFGDAAYDRRTLMENAAFMDLLKNDAHANTFEKLAWEWHTNKLATWHETTARDTLRRLDVDIFPEISPMPIAAITHKT